MITQLRLIKEYFNNVMLLRSLRLFSQDRPYYFRVFKRQYKRYKYWIEPTQPSEVPIDVIIPAIEKDLQALPLAISSVHKHVKHPIGKIYVVAPVSPAIISVAEKNGAVFVDEKSLCNITKQEINYVVNGDDRSGWIYQQLLKFNFYKLGSHENYLVLDADTVFIKDIVFVTNSKSYFDFSDEYHKPYYKAYELLTGYRHSMSVSFVAHYMLFNKRKLLQLNSHIENTTGKEIAEAIKELKDKIQDRSAFSEYETYANYCLQNHAGQHSIRYWFNNSMRNSELKDFDTTAALHKDKYKSISFHAYNME